MQIFVSDQVFAVKSRAVLNRSFVFMLRVGNGRLQMRAYLVLSRVTCNQDPRRSSTILIFFVYRVLTPSKTAQQLADSFTATHGGVEVRG